MTVDEAKTKWCPFARVTEAGNPPDRGSVYNRMETDGCEVWVPQACMCIANGCMAWRTDYGYGPASVHGHCGLVHK